MRCPKEIEIKLNLEKILDKEKDHSTGNILSITSTLDGEFSRRFNRGWGRDSLLFTSGSYEVYCDGYLYLKTRDIAYFNDGAAIRQLNYKMYLNDSKK